MRLSESSTAISKNIEGKTQEAFGNSTGNLKDQAAGKAKQVESQVRNTIDLSGNMVETFRRNVSTRVSNHAHLITGDV
nr:CsbD family protein [Anabaena sphaerica]